jgi:Holliday junction resolvasome RuvABC endonuclease subunit
MTKYIIGVDGGLRFVGINVLDNTAKRLDSFCITTKSGEQPHRSIDSIVEEFFERLNPYIGEGDKLHKRASFFIEDITFSRAGDKTHARAEVIGVIKYLIRQSKINVYGVNPGAANSFLDTRYGIKPTKRRSAQQKIHTKATIHRHGNFYTDNEHIADAYVMSLYGYAYLIEKQRLTITPQCKILF